MNRRTLLKSSILTLLPLGRVFAARTDSILNGDEQKIVDFVLPIQEYKPTVYSVNNWKGRYNLLFRSVRPTPPDIYYYSRRLTFVDMVEFDHEPNINWDKVNKTLGYECKVIR